jgi:hypothetical protein
VRLQGSMSLLVVVHEVPLDGNEIADGEKGGVRGGLGGMWKIWLHLRLNFTGHSGLCISEQGKISPVRLEKARALSLLVAW